MKELHQRGMEDSRHKASDYPWQGAQCLPGTVCVGGEGGLMTEPGPGASRGLLRGPSMTWT